MPPGPGNVQDSHGRHGALGNVRAAGACQAAIATVHILEKEKGTGMTGSNEARKGSSEIYE